MTEVWLGFLRGRKLAVTLWELACRRTRGSGHACL